MKRFLILPAAAVAMILSTTALSDDTPPNGNQLCQIAILSDTLPGVDLESVRALVSRLEQDGCAVTELSAAEACDQQELSADKFFLYIIPACRTYPAAGFESLIAYSRNRGHVLFLGGPFLDDPLYLGPDGWLNKNAILAMKQHAQPTYEPFGHAPLSTEGWQRTTDRPNTPGSWDVVPEGPEGEPCFHYTTDALEGWDGHLSPTVTQLFGPEHDLFSFMAKGDPHTSQVAVEIQEQDGSRWIAVANIRSEWGRIALEPGDFKYWPDSRARTRRGGQRDQLRPAQARRVNFQLARSHTSAVAPGAHAFWIADMGTCINPAKAMDLTAGAGDHTLETIFPRYKVYSLPDGLDVRPTEHIRSWPEGPLVTAATAVCAIPRTMGSGFQRDAKWRYIPLAAATDAHGLHRGGPAWLLLNQANPHAGSIFGCIGWNDLRQLSARPQAELILGIVRRLRLGVFLQQAGAEHFAYWPGEGIKLGAIVANWGTQGASTSVRLTVLDEHGAEVHVASKDLQLAVQDTVTWQVPATLPAPQPGSLRVVTELFVDGNVVDRIGHEITLIAQRSPDPEAFLSVQGNDFFVHGKKWYPVGVNYWPLYVSGMDHADYSAGWIQRRFYDPALVEQDLARMEALGINMVSIQANKPEYYRNLVDFIQRCGRHGIYVNLFCELASPLSLRERELRQFIQTARLAENPTIMAYDTIWEPGNSVFRSDSRAGWDPDWQQWIRQQYGSPAAAEQDWEFSCPRNEAGQVVAPPDEYFREDGPWRTMMAAYRRFMDDLMSRKWNQAHRALRKIDPHHLISFRQGNTLPHDFTFTATAKHIDFICPEGYSIPHSQDGYYAAGFITKYVHFTTRGKPIVWSEFGQSVWDALQMEPSAERIKAVSDYHELFYRMVLESGANGTVPWWWPGGYRVGERSDYGIVNPDGLPRPAAELIARYAPRLTAERQWPAPTSWYEMDRDAHAGGYWHVCFNAGRDAYRDAVVQGAPLGVRTAGTGTTSADTPLLAVGNRPCHGQNPPKFLNAEFNWLQILDTSGQWVEVLDGANICVPSGVPVRARVSVGNTQEATWLAPSAQDLQTGDVLLATTAQSELAGQWYLPQTTPYLADADFGEIELAPGIENPTRVELRMTAHQRTAFGETRTFVLATE